MTGGENYLVNLEPFANWYFYNTIIYQVWRAEDGILCRTLEGHAHWVNTLALSTDYVLRTGPFHPILDRLDATNDSKIYLLHKF